MQDVGLTTDDRASLAALEISMANSRHLDVLRQGPKKWNDYSEEQRLEYPDLTNADLQGLDLTGVNLTKAQLSAAICVAQTSAMPF